MSRGCVLLTTACFVIISSQSVSAQSRSAIRFYDSTGTTATARIGWDESSGQGQFFVETPNDGNGITAQNGNLTVDGTVTATGFSGDGSMLNNLPAPSILAEDVIDLPDSLATRAPAGHGHTISQTTSLQDSLDSKAPVTHTHTISQTTGLQDSLNSRAPAAHAHAIGEISGTVSTSRIENGQYMIDTAGSADNQVWKWNGIAGEGYWGTDATGAASGGGDISAVGAGPGLTGGGSSDSVTLGVSFGGNGSDNTVSHSDHSHTITSGDIQDGTVASLDIANGSVDSADIAQNAVDSYHLRSGSVTSSQILDGSVASSDILDGTVASADIANGTIDSADIAQNGVGSYHLRTGSVGTDEIGDGSIGNADITSTPSERIAGTKIIPDFGTTETLQAGVGRFTDTLKVESSRGWGWPVLSMANTSSSYTAANVICPGGQWMNFRMDHQTVQAQSVKIGFFRFMSDLNSSGSSSPTKILVHGGGTDPNNNVSLHHSGDGGEGQIATDAGNIAIIPAGGTVTVTGTMTATTSCCPSDRRYKKNLDPYRHALDRVQKLRCVSFDWDREGHPDMGFSDDRQVGLIAQEVEQAIPEAVQRGQDGHMMLSYDKLTAVLVEAVKEQQVTIDAQQHKIDQLSQQVSELAQRVASGDPTEGDDTHIE